MAQTQTKKHTKTLTTTVPKAPPGPDDGMQQRASKKAAYAAARADYLDLRGDPPPKLATLATRHGIDLCLLMQLSVKERWDSLRAASLAQRELGRADLRIEAVRRVDRVIVETIETIATKAGSAYAALISEIADMPTGEGLSLGGPEEPDSRPSETLQSGLNEKPTTSVVKTRRGPRVKPMLLIKTDALNAATEGFSKFALSLRDLGMLLIPEKPSAESASGLGSMQLNPAALIQINQMMKPPAPAPEPIDVTPPPPPPI